MIKILNILTKDQDSQSNPEQKKKSSWRHHNLEFKAHYKAILIKTALHWEKNGHPDQCNQIKSPEVNPCTHSPLILTKVSRPYVEERIIYSINDSGKSGYVCRRMHPDPYSSLIPKNQLKMGQDLNERHESMKLWEENVQETLKTWV